MGAGIPGFHGRIDPSRDNLSADEAEMLVARFVMLTERGAPIPPDLQAFILAGLRRQLLDGSGGWTGRTRGRPSNDDDERAEWAKMRAWYCFHLAPEFADLPKVTGDRGRAAAVGEHLGLSESTVKRHVRGFAESGFAYLHLPEGDAVTAQRRKAHADTMNMEKARLFCALWLGLSDGEEALAPPTGGPVDILASWARQADHPRPAPAPSPAEIKAREIVAFWRPQPRR
ncbi:hypothetical protein SAMN04244572_00500 [Azotobacter beijerinckii]|uniref:Uncharacterized protein n=1 Tax=Azotobacter beijerinckii TaxID=170623 RepID=A0A1H6R7C9_9GAMM|nr:hypothetical protein [Azotobacter beijerinckii]SEI48437.1 hypothetical protein SAMN04244572_00500 [Azotobacter beijerinckii]